MPRGRKNPVSRIKKAPKGGVITGEGRLMTTLTSMMTTPPPAPVARNSEGIGPDPAALRSAGRLIRAIAKGRVGRADVYQRLYLRLHEWIEKDVAGKWKFREETSAEEVFYQFMKRVMK